MFICLGVLVLGGIKSVFFIAAHMVLFWIYDQAALLMHSGLAIAEQYLHSIKAFWVSHSTPPASRLGLDKRLGGSAAGQLTYCDQRHVPYLVTSCAAMKLQGSLTAGSGARGQSGHQSDGGEQLHFALLGFLCFVLFCLFFPLIYETCFISTHEYSHFCPSDSFPHPAGASDRLAVWGLAAFLGLTLHNRS